MIKTLKDLNRNQIVTLRIIRVDPLIKIKKYADTYTRLGASIDKNGRPVTGLTEIIRDGNKVVSRGTRLEMEKELDMSEGSLKPGSAFWITYNIMLDSEDTRLDLQDPHDLLKFLFASAQSNVAGSIEEIDTNSKAEFVLYSEEEESKVRVKAKSILKQAYNMSDKLDLETKINLCTVYGILVDASEVNTIENKITEELERDPVKFLKMVDDENLIYNSLMRKALNVGILELKDGGVYHGEIVVGYDLSEAARNLAKDKKLTTILKAKLTGDMSIIQEALSQ